MNTQSHALLTFFAIRWPLGRRGEDLPHLHGVLFWGALTPDLPLYVFFLAYTLIDPTPQRVLWGDLYFRPHWQAVFNAFHAFPLWAAAIAASVALRLRRTALFGTAGLLASAQDFLLHHDDGHAHLFPFSDYRFRSPVSYWDPSHHGQMASAAEFVAVLAVSFWIYRRLETRWGRALLVLAVASLFGTGVLWNMIFHFL